MTGRLRTFWQRVSDGIEIQQLWAQFHAESRTSYELYAKEVTWTKTEGESGWRRFWRVAWGLSWSMMMKLSPGRRVLFLIALVLLFFPAFSVHTEESDFDLESVRFFGGIGLLVLLALDCPTG